MYRLSDELYESGIFSKTTQRDCYLLLLRFLHFADNDIIYSKDIYLVYYIYVRPYTLLTIKKL